MDRYPDINDPDFQFLIARRLEFRNLDNEDGLYPHQEFVRRFMSPYTPYKSLIMYHSLGSGKSIACIAVAVDHFLHDGKKCIIVTKGDSGTDNFAKQIRMYQCMSRDADAWDPSLFTMRHYISMSNQIGNMSDEDVVKSFSNTIMVMDEVHNVRYLKNASETSVYGSIVRLLKLCDNVKIIIATATPMTDSPEQIHSLLGICNYSRPECSWSMNGIISYNSTVCDRPVSKKIGTKEYIPDMPVHASHMQGHQRRAYSIEHKTQPPDDIYRKLTHISLFCFPDGTNGRDVTENKMSTSRMKTTITGMSTKQTKEIKYVKYNTLPEHAHALVGEDLRDCSSKYSEVVRLIEESEGNVFIFLEEVKGSGLLLLASVMEQHGYELYLGEDLTNVPPGRRYTMCVGSSEICPNNSDRLDGFNSDANRHGDYVRILLGSKVIGESITLKNVRQFYCLTPHWNDSTVDQAIGRVVRNGSHTALDESERNVEIYIHASIFPDDPHNSVDIKKLAKCKEKEKNIAIVEQMMTECAVDKYIRDQSVPITDVVNFAAAYVHNHEKKMQSSVSKMFFNVKTGRTVSVHRIAAKLKMDITICKEALCRMIYNNVMVDNRFLRAYGDAVFAVEDPSLPHVMVPDADVPRQESNIEVLPSPVIASADVQFRYMPVVRKAAFLEDCITQGRHEALESMNTVYADIDGVLCHLLLYRDLASSYTSSNPVPKKAQGKTRVYDGASWSDVSSVELERHLLVQYRSIVSRLIEEYDETHRVYGVISTIDGEMRLRLRDMEDHGKSSRDNRYVRRGKSVKSIRKDVLLDILSQITGEVVPPSTSINEAASRIDDVLVRKGLYVML